MMAIDMWAFLGGLGLGVFVTAIGVSYGTTNRVNESWRAVLEEAVKRDIITFDQAYRIRVIMKSTRG